MNFLGGMAAVVLIAWFVWPEEAGKWAAKARWAYKIELMRMARKEPRP